MSIKDTVLQLQLDAAEPEINAACAQILRALSDFPIPTSVLALMRVVSLIIAEIPDMDGRMKLCDSLADTLRRRASIQFHEPEQPK